MASSRERGLELEEQNRNKVPNDFNRSYFPNDFIFGTASSAFQYEGEANTKGRGLCIWDTFSHDFPEKIADGSNGDVAVDFYNRYKGDVQLMKELGMNAFRFSISWSRILPSGRLSGGVNKEGIEFYNNLINELKANGLEPSVTLFHWDTPQALEDEYDGFLSSKIVDDFQDFADLCFELFGDRVKHWITFNEPWSYCFSGYDIAIYAPGRCSKWVSKPCKEGNSATEPYIVGHNMLLSHGAAVNLYREKYKHQNGKIGITLVCLWMEPYSNSVADQSAARRSLDFFFGWFFDPLVHGDYPLSMREFVGDRLPSFTEEEILKLKGSFDFLGLNYYSARYVVNAEYVDPTRARYSTDCHAEMLTERDGVPIGPKAASPWLYIYPEGIRSLLKYIKECYNNPVIYITENGMDDFNDGTLELEKSINDPVREQYFKDHLWNIYRAMKEDKVDVKGYFAWSLLDNFEWQGGYTLRFGLYYIDFKDDLKRHPRNSVKWFKYFLGSNTHVNDADDGIASVTTEDEH